MKILVDTNVLLDVLQNRKPFVDTSLKVFQICEVNQAVGYISAMSIPNLVYIMRKELDQKQIKEVLTKLTAIFKVIDLRKADLFRAADLQFSDYEDALQCVCASSIKVDYIVTRNTKDFSNSPIVAITPNELIQN